MPRVLVLAAACCTLAACALDPAKVRQDKVYGTGTNIPNRGVDRVDTYSAEALAEEIRRNPPANHPNNTGEVPRLRR